MACLFNGCNLLIYIKRVRLNSRITYCQGGIEDVGEAVKDILNAPSYLHLSANGVQLDVLVHQLVSRLVLANALDDLLLTSLGAGCEAVHLLVKGTGFEGLGGFYHVFKLFLYVARAEVSLIN